MIQTVFVIDDDLAIREAIASLLRSVGIATEVFESSDAFLKRGAGDLAGCLVLDVRLQGASGLEFQRELMLAEIHLPIIFITGYGDIPMSVHAIRSGAVEFLTKPFRDQDLLDAVHKALEIDQAAQRTRKALAHLQDLNRTLTCREKEVMEKVVLGHPNKQIAAELGISEVTVKVHRGQIMRKMRAKSLADLVRMAEKLGFFGEEIVETAPKRA